MGMTEEGNRSFPSLRRGFDSLHPLHSWLVSGSNSVNAGLVGTRLRTDFDTTFNEPDQSFAVDL